MKGYQDLKIKSVETLTVTPAIAENMLLKNIGNRKLRPDTVSRYSKSMKTGNWKSTHQGIAIDEFGNIIDGQHRLAAVVKSGTTIITTLTIYKGELDAKMVPLDIGKNRTSHDLTGLSSGEISIYNAISYLFPSLSKGKIDPVSLNYMASVSKTELEYLTEISGISSLKSSAGVRGSGLERIWSGGAKAACLAAIIDNIDISVIKEFNEVPISNPILEEYHNFYLDLNGLGAGPKFIITIMPMFWSILKYKKFIDQNDFDEIDKNRTELRKIFLKKYPEIFG